MSSAEEIETVIARFGPALLDLAEASIAHGLRNGRPLAVALADYPDQLHHHTASFVTLHLDGKLRGCTGTAVACRPLAEDVAGNAFSSAFDDPRFDPLAEHEAARLDTEVSLLTGPEPVAFRSEQALIAGLVPGRDGLILESGSARGLFLPQVWDMVAGPGDFLSHLKIKAGLKKNFWSPDIRISRFLAFKTSRARPAPDATA